MLATASLLPPDGTAGTRNGHATLSATPGPLAFVAGASTRVCGAGEMADRGGKTVAAQGKAGTGVPGPSGPGLWGLTLFVSTSEFILSQKYPYIS